MTRKELERIASRVAEHVVERVQRILRAVGPGGERWRRVEVVAIVGTAFVAFIALGVSAGSLYLERQHKRLSVQPSMIFNFHANDEGAGWTVSNAGLGPAVVRWFRVTVDTKPATSWEQMVNLLWSNRPDVGTGPRIKSQIGVLNRDSFMPTGSTHFLFVVDDRESITFLKGNRSRVVMEVCYCSVYGECWLARTRYSADRRLREQAACDSIDVPPFGIGGDWPRSK